MKKRFWILFGLIVAVATACGTLGGSRPCDRERFHFDRGGMNR